MNDPAMDSFSKKPNELLVDYAYRVSRMHLANRSNESRGVMGQFFTAKSVAQFMAGMFDLNRDEINILDPGAGTGILTAALCEKILDHGKMKNVHIDAYETDESVIPYLESVLEACKAGLAAKGAEASFTIIQKDFIINNAPYMKDVKGLDDAPLQFYDYAISNPPYYKLSKDSAQALALKEVVAGQPNIYPLFMAMTSRMLRPDGQMVFITPRSFCSGLYYRKFREWFLARNNILGIHIFESRKAVFDGDEVLQENIITKVSKRTRNTDHDILITVSLDKGFKDLRTLSLKSSEVVYRQNGDVFIRVPSSEEELDVIRIVDTWVSNLHALGFEISTGPVVDFRTDYLLKKMDDSTNVVPLLWMHNIREGRMRWPNGESDKPPAIEDRRETDNILLPMRTYVLLKRFSSKEQLRRLDAAVLLKHELPYEKIGIENHLNYVYRVEGELSNEEAFGLATLFNTRLLDLFFRSLNGHTQVNATEIRAIPFPPLKDVREIGKLAIQGMNDESLLPDAIVFKVLGIKTAQGEMITNE